MQFLFFSSQYLLVALPSIGKLITQCFQIKVSTSVHYISSSYIFSFPWRSLTGSSVVIVSEMCNVVLVILETAA